MVRCNVALVSVRILLVVLAHGFLELFRLIFLELVLRFLFVLMMFLLLLVFCLRFVLLEFRNFCLGHIGLD